MWSKKWSDIPKTKGEELKKQVTEEQKTAILNEKDVRAIHDYMGSGVAYALNYNLRKNLPLSETQADIVKNLDIALSKLPDYHGIVYRSIDIQMLDVSREEFFAAHQPGGYVNYPAYTSTASEVYDDSMDIQMIIISKTGKDIRMWNDEENEILFRRNSLFVPTKVDGNTIYLEEI